MHRLTEEKFPRKWHVRHKHFSIRCVRDFMLSLQASSKVEIEIRLLSNKKNANRLWIHQAIQRNEEEHFYFHNRFSTRAHIHLLVQMAKSFSRSQAAILKKLLFCFDFQKR